VGIDNPVHLIFIAVVALIFLGPKRLPELARAAGKGMREFRESLNGEGEGEGIHGPAGVAPQQYVAEPTQQHVAEAAQQHLAVPSQSPQLPSGVSADEG
jgi:sec-independent protein translocase protein TatA